MSKVFIEETTLTAIGEAIRAKTGKEELIAPLDMPAAIEGIETGGGGEVPDDVFLMTGDCKSKLANNTWNYFMENEPFKSQFRSENITNASSMFSSCNQLEHIPFTLNFAEDSTNGVDINTIFANCTKLKELPELGTLLYAKSAQSIFDGVYLIKEIPQSWVDNFRNEVLVSKANTNLSGALTYLRALREIPVAFMKKLRGYEDETGYFYTLYYRFCAYCYCLNEIKGIPVYGKLTSNAFSSAFTDCSRIEELQFESNDDGTPKVANWKNQTIDLSIFKYIGYTYSLTNITSNNDDFTKADLVNSNSHSSSAEMEAAIAANPNWFTDNIATSRYTKFSAINTINSLPDTSAYIAANGGTNTIKFTSTQGGGRTINGVNGMIGNLTEEEIAVATAKGWTVSLV